MGMDPLIGAALISAAGSFVTGGASTGASVLTSKLQLKNQKELSAYQNQLQLNNLKLSPSLQMQGLKAAGISPQFMNGVNPAPSVSGGSAQPVEANVPSIDIGSAAQSLSQSELNGARTVLTNVDVDRMKNDLYYQEEVVDARIIEAKANAEKRSNEAGMSKVQLKIMQDTQDATIRKAEAIVNQINADVLLKDKEASLKDLEYIRQSYATQNYEQFYNLGLARLRADLDLVASEVRKNDSQSQLNYDSAALVRQQKITEILEGESLGYQNSVASAVYKLQATALRARYIMERRQYDSTYVPTKQEQQDLFNYNKSIQELEAAAKQFDVDHQSERYVMEWINVIGNQVGNVVGSVVPFKVPKAGPNPITINNYMGKKR